MALNSRSLNALSLNGNFRFWHARTIANLFGTGDSTGAAATSVAVTAINKLKHVSKDQRILNLLHQFRRDDGEEELVEINVELKFNNSSYRVSGKPNTIPAQINISNINRISGGPIVTIDKVMVKNK